MNVIHRYILREVLRYLLLSIMALCALFLIVDFFDRIDNILQEDASVWIVTLYFLLKIPQIFTMTLPVAMLVAVMLGIGLLSKNSEITAMRAAGMPILWITRPLFVLALGLSLLDLAVEETVVPYCSRRVKEIYNIDIKAKDKTGTFSRQDDFWWRAGEKFYSASMFDSRDDTLHALSIFEIGEAFYPVARTDAERAVWVKKGLGWTMHNVTQRIFPPDAPPQSAREPSAALPIEEQPEDFYDVKTDPFTMSYSQLKQFIHNQVRNGAATSGYLADLYSKIAFPFVILVCTLVVLPFSLKPGRSGSMAASFVAGMVIGFTYYAVHSFSLAMGRAEIWPPLVAAWIANGVMIIVGLILNLGAESPG